MRCREQPNPSACHLSKEFEAAFLKFAFCPKELGGCIALRLPAGGTWGARPGETLGEGVLCGCRFGVPPRTQRELRSAVGALIVDVVLSANLSWLICRKAIPLFSCPPRPWPWPSGETNTRYSAQPTEPWFQ